MPLNENLDVKVRALTGSSTNETSLNAVKDSVSLGVKWVIHNTPDALLEPLATENEVTADGYSLTNTTVVRVRRGERQCEEVGFDQKAAMRDPNSLFFIPQTTKYPKYYIHNNKLFVLPVGNAYVLHIPNRIYDASTYTTTILGDFDNAVIKYAASLDAQALAAYHLETEEDIELANGASTMADKMYQAALAELTGHLSAKGFALQPQGQTE